MPNRNDHLLKSKHNEDFYLSFDIGKTLYKDWIVVGIFYSALHLIDAHFALSNKHPFAHGMRDEWIRNDWRLSKIWPDYRDLKEFRQKASYKIYDFTSQKIKDEVFPLLDSIKKFLQGLTPPPC
jgi:hypothetical protein